MINDDHIDDYDATSEYDDCKTKEPSIKKVSEVQLFRRRWQIRRLSHFHHFQIQV